MEDFKLLIEQLENKYPNDVFILTDYNGVTLFGDAIYDDSLTKFIGEITIILTPDIEDYIMMKNSGINKYDVHLVDFKISNIGMDCIYENNVLWANLSSDSAKLIINYDYKPIKM